MICKESRIPQSVTVLRETRVKICPILSNVGGREPFEAAFLTGNLTSSFGRDRGRTQSSVQLGKWW